MADQSLDINFANATPPQKNLSMLGRCFDIETTDPLDLGGSALIESAFPFKFNDGYGAVPDNSMVLPQGVLYKPGAGGTFSSQTEFAASEEEFITRISGTVSFGAGVPGIAAFKASASASYYREEARKGKKEVTYSRIAVNDDILRIDHYYPPTIDRKGRIGYRNGGQGLAFEGGFLDAIAAIHSEESAHDFIGTYGTHYSKQIGFGGIAFQWIFMTEEQRDTLQRDGIDIAIEAEGVLKGVALSGGASASWEGQEKFREVTRANRQFVNFVGGLPNQNLYDWAATVPGEPTAITAVLEPHAELLEDKDGPQHEFLMKALRARNLA